MTSIFQTLINFLDYFLNPVYNVLYTVVSYITYALTTILNAILGVLQTVLNGVIFGSFWLLDRFFVLSIAGIHALFGESGMLSSVASPASVSQIVNAGAVGLTWIRNFVDINKITTPLFVYISFLLIWTVYKLIKSWIPGIGN